MNVDGRVFRTETNFPTQAFALDENFLIVKTDAGLTVSRDLQGYHFYGAELCDVARRLGYGSYVIDFMIRHDSKGNLDKDFYLSKKHLEEKYRTYRAVDGIATTCTQLCWSESFFRKMFSLAHAMILLELYDHPQAGEAGRIMLKLFAPTLPGRLVCLPAKFLFSLPEIMRSFYKKRVRIAFWRFRRDLQWWSRNWKSRLLP